MQPPPGFRLVAILRGITPAEAPAIAAALLEAGIREVEVPLNSPDPFSSIGLIREVLPDDCRVGAGTVLDVAQVDACGAAGGTLIVSPNLNPTVVARALELGLEPIPGVATPTEAFAALAAGARSIKAFPGETIGPAGLKAWKAVLPPEAAVLAVGGVAVDNLDAWRSAGAAGVGIGGGLYRPGDDADQVRRRAIALVTAAGGLQ